MVKLLFVIWLLGYLDSLNSLSAPHTSRSQKVQGTHSEFLRSLGDASLHRDHSDRCFCNFFV